MKYNHGDTETENFSTYEIKLDDKKKKETKIEQQIFIIYTYFSINHASYVVVTKSQK